MNQLVIAHRKSQVNRRASASNKCLKLFPIVCLLLAGCSEPTSTEAAIRTTIEQAELAAEARDLGDIRALIAEQYADRRGNEKKEIENLLRLIFLAHQSVHLAVHIESIDIRGPDVADVIALVGMADTADGLPDVDLYQFDVRLVSDDGEDWQVIDADWRRGLGKPPR